MPRAPSYAEFIVEIATRMEETFGIEREEALKMMVLSAAMQIQEEFGDKVAKKIVADVARFLR